MLIDGHAHLYRCYDVELFLASAETNLRCVARTLGLEHTWCGCLLLAESKQTASLRELMAARQGCESSGWQFTATDEAHSLLAWSHAQRPLSIVLGSQLVSCEGVELLVYPRFAQSAGNRTLWELLELAWLDDAITIIPWGLGKWSFSRRRVIADTLECYRQGGGPPDAELYLGDSGNRLDLLPEPHLLRKAANHGTRILPGTDPLPFPGEASRAGNCGFALSGSWDHAKPLASIKRLLRECVEQPTTCSRRRGVISFGRHHLAMQFRKLCKNL